MASGRTNSAIAGSFAGLLDEGGDGMEEAAQQAAGPLPQLAADQIERLDAVGAFVDLGDARIADELLHAVVADIAVAAPDLHGEVGAVEAEYR